MAISMIFSGTGVIIAGHINLTRSPWLGAGIILYILALGLATGYVNPRSRKLVAATAPDPPEGAAPAGAPASPPPHIALLLRQVQLGGMALIGLVVVIVFLMVVKPGGTA